MWLLASGTRLNISSRLRCPLFTTFQTSLDQQRHTLAFTWLAVIPQSYVQGSLASSTTLMSLSLSKCHRGSTSTQRQSFSLHRLETPHLHSHLISLSVQSLAEIQPPVTFPSSARVVLRCRLATHAPEGWRETVVGGCGASWWCSTRKKSSTPSLSPRRLHHLLLLPCVMSGLPLVALTPLFPISLNMYLPHLALPACRLWEWWVAPRECI